MSLALDVLRYVLIYGAGVVIAVLLFGAGWLSCHREEKALRAELERQHRAEMNDLERRANAALDAIALETALAYAPADFAEWETEMREETP